MTTVLVLGTLDSKGEEYRYLIDRLRGHDVEVLVVDTGVRGQQVFAADVAADQVAAAGGASIDELRTAGDRGSAVAAMTRGAVSVVAGLAERVDAAIALGGTGGTSIAAAAFRELPVGVPKVVVSTAASGDTRAYVGESDLTLMPSVTDVAGINRLSAQILANAAAAVAGMAKAPRPELDATRPMVAASMFGVTTPCVERGRMLLEEAGYEVLTFHMTGAGGRALESLARGGWLAGVLDVTSTELADELVGGVFRSEPSRFTAAGLAGIPQVVSVGALDMVNFGPYDSVPAQFAGRTLYRHNDSITLMRTTPLECAELGRRLAERVSSGTALATIFVPLRGISAIAGEGGPFHDPEADQALFDAVRKHVGDHVELVELDLAINDPAFADAMVAKLLDHLVPADAARGSAADGKA